MSRSQAETVYSASENICWVHDNNRVIVVDEQKRSLVVLYGAEAAIWGWLTLNYPYARILAAVGELWGLQPTEADRRMRALLQSWRRRGLLAVKARDSDG